jgi:hypothetical protein
MDIELKLEEKCSWGDWGKHPAYCEDGKVSASLKNIQYTTGRPCPRCHGTALQPTPIGREILDFVRKYLMVELTDGSLGKLTE